MLKVLIRYCIFAFFISTASNNCFLPELDRSIQNTATLLQLIGFNSTNQSISSAIELSSKTYTGVKVNWEPAFQSKVSASYKIYASLVNTWTTIHEVESNATLLQDYTDNLLSFSLSNLIAYQFYRVDVIGRDSSGNKILLPGVCFQMDPNTPTTIPCKMELGGQVTTFAGTCGTAGATTGPISTALYSNNAGMVFLNNKLYIADSGNFRVRQIDLTTSNDSVLAGSVDGYLNGTGTTARLSSSRGVTTNGSSLYYVEITNKGVRQIEPTTQSVTSFVGNPIQNPPADYLDATGGMARFNELPHGVYNFWDGALYIADSNSRIRKVTIPSAIVTTVAGNGLNTQTNGAALTNSIGDPNHILPYGSILYIGTFTGSNIRRLDLISGMLSSVSTNVTANSRKGMAVMGKFLYLAEESDHAIYKIDLTNFNKTLLAGSVGVMGNANGTRVAAQFNSPLNLTFFGNSLYVADRGNHCIRKVD